MSRAALSLREHDKLRQAGADVVFSGEVEVALAITEALLRRLGATPDQIDRERERVRAELFGADAGETSWPDGAAWSGPLVADSTASPDAAATSEAMPEAEPHRDGDP